MNPETPSVYDLIGGEITFFRLVDSFYKKVEADAMLRSMFPADLSAGKYWQFLFLMQYWGGPSRYAELRGHPRLRMRHNPFPISPMASQAWLTYMLEAIDDVGIEEPARTMMREYFQHGAGFMVNRFEQETDA